MESARNRLGVVGIALAILVLALPCHAQDESWAPPDLPAAMSGSHPARDFAAANWNGVYDLGRVAIPTSTFLPAWDDPAVGTLVQTWQRDPLAESTMYRLQDAGTEFECYDVKRGEDFLQFARVRGTFRDRTVVSAEHLRRSDSGMDLSFPVRSTKLNVATRAGKFTLFGEFLTNNWNSLVEGGGSLGPGFGSAGLTLAAPDAGLVGTPGTNPVRKPIWGDDVTVEMGAKIPLTSVSESRVSFQRNNDRERSVGTTDRLGIEGALRLTDGIKLRAGYERSLSRSAVDRADRDEDSVWTGVVLNF